jgi:hypothetical protein
MTLARTILLLALIAGCYGTPATGLPDAGAPAGGRGGTGGGGGSVLDASGSDAAGTGGVGGTVDAALEVLDASGSDAGGAGGAGGSSDAALEVLDATVDVSPDGSGDTADAEGCREIRGVIDFEAVSHTGSFVALPRPYVDASGLSLTSTTSMSVVGSGALQYLNTTGIVTARDATVTLTRGGGKPFTLLKINLSAYNDEHPGIVYSFTGHKPDGSTETVDIPLRTIGLGFVPYTLPASFQGLSSVEWTMNAADNAQYFDDIAFSFCQ